jgi:magnesium chelatase subunit D
MGGIPVNGLNAPNLPPPGAPQLPLSAVVGQEDAKLALLLQAVDPRIGGVLLRGEKGTAKSTLARGLAALLPGSAPFVELPIGATEDRVVGSIDLGAALTSGREKFRPGLLAVADGGVLYVDEINLLPDHLVDVLLDVAASGVNRVERDGISHVHPSRFLLVGSMNPEEGDLRPQLLDRFGLAVAVRTARDPAERAAAVRRRLAFDVDPGGALAASEVAAAEAELRRRLVDARPAWLSDGVIEEVASLCAAMGAEGLRADLTICRAAAALAGWEGRQAVSAADVRRVAHLALGHRARRDPLEPAGLDEQRLADALDEHVGPAHADGGPADADEGPVHADGGPAEADEGPADADEEAAEADEEAAAGEERQEFERQLDGPEPAPSGSAPSEGLSGAASSDATPSADGESRAPVDPGPAGLTAPALGGRLGRRQSAPASGRRAPVDASRGRLVGDRAPDGPLASVAVAATVRRAAARIGAGDGPRAVGASTAGVQVRPEDLREAVRVDRSANLIVLAVDASGSMGAPERMEAAKGAVLGLLTDAYQRRDLVGLVAFRGEAATVLLRPTGSVEVARARLAALPTGGRTPLAAGIATALDLVTTPARAATHRPVLVLVTDGRATFAPAGVDPVAAATSAADAVRRAGVEAVVIDVEDTRRVGPAPRSGAPSNAPGAPALGLARDLAARMGARHVPLGAVTPEGLRQVVREQALLS